MPHGPIHTGHFAFHLGGEGANSCRKHTRLEKPPPQKPLAVKPEEVDFKPSVFLGRLGQLSGRPSALSAHQRQAGEAFKERERLYLAAGQRGTPARALSAPGPSRRARPALRPGTLRSLPTGNWPCHRAEPPRFPARRRAVGARSRRRLPRLTSSARTAPPPSPRPARAAGAAPEGQTMPVPHSPAANEAAAASRQAESGSRAATTAAERPTVPPAAAIFLPPPPRAPIVRPRPSALPLAPRGPLPWLG